MANYTPADRRSHEAGITTRGAEHVSTLATLTTNLNNARTARDSAKLTFESALAAYTLAQKNYDDAANAWSCESTLAT